MWWLETSGRQAKEVCYLWRSISLWFFVRSSSPSADASSFFVRASWTGPTPTRVAVFSSPFSVDSWSHHKSPCSCSPTSNSPVSHTSERGECWASGPCMGRSTPNGPDDCIFVRFFVFSVFWQFYHWATLNLSYPPNEQLIGLVPLYLN